MNEDARKKVIDELHDLRGQVGERLGNEPQHHDVVVAHIEQVRTRVERGPVEGKSAHAAAGELERRLLAWEAEHPTLTSLAARIARALEDAGL